MQSRASRVIMQLRSATTPPPVATPGDGTLAGLREHQARPPSHPVGPTGFFRRAHTWHRGGSMAQAATASKTTASSAEADEHGHVWVGAATVTLTFPQAKRADLRGSIRVPEQTRIDVLETYCKGCRKPFEDAAGERCASLTSPELFHGGPINTRAKRTGHGMPGHSCIELGCNTAINVAAAQTQAARRNGFAPDVRKPPPPPLAPEAQRRTAARKPRTAATVVVAQAPARIGVLLAAAASASPDEEARLAARILASRRGRVRERNPLALTLW